MLLGALVATLLLAGTTTAQQAPNQASNQQKAPVSCSKANALLRVGEDAAARKAYIAVLEEEPSSACARKGFEKLKASNPRSAAADCARGDAYWRADREEDAVKAFEAALEKNPQSPCAKKGLDEISDSTSFERHKEDIVNWAITALEVLGLLILVLFAYLLLGYVPILRVAVRHTPYVGKWIGPRLSIEGFDDEAVEGKPGAPIAARIKERMHRMREEAVTEDGAIYGIDASLPREDFADFVSENGNLKNALEKASDISDQTKTVAALLYLAYVLLPIKRISVTATMEPPASKGAAATMIIEQSGRLEAATTVQGPPLATGEPGASDYSLLADPAAVWVQYEVARVLAKQKNENPAKAKAYALVREGLDYQQVDEWPKDTRVLPAGNRP